MLNRNQKTYAVEKENPMHQERNPMYMRNSSVVDILVQSLQNSTGPLQNQHKGRETMPAASKPSGDLFKLVSSHLHSVEQSTDVRNAPPIGNNIKRKESDEQPTLERQSRSFKKLKEEDAHLPPTGPSQALTNLKNQLLEHQNRLEKKIYQRIKKQQQYTNEVKQQIRRSIPLLVQQLNTRFTLIDRSVLSIKQNNLVVSKNLELFREMVDKQSGQLSARVEILEQGKQEESVYDLQLAQSKDQANEKFQQQIQAKYVNLVTDITKEIEAIRQQLLKKVVPTIQAPTQAAKPQIKDSKQLRQMMDSIAKQYSQKSQPRLTQVQRIVRIHEDNIMRIHTQFQRVLNEHLNPRVMKIEEMVKKLPAVSPVQENGKKLFDQLQKIKNQLSDKLAGSKVLRLRTVNNFESGVLGKAQSINMTDCYFVDQNGFLIDCNGTYLVDEQAQKIKLQEDQLYFLSMNGININKLT